MKLTSTISRYILGVVFALAGFVGLFNLAPQPTDLPADMITFMSGMMAAKYFFPLLKATELIAGLFLVLQVAPVLMLMILAPIVLNIVLLHLSLTPGIENQLLPFGILVLFILACYNYRAILFPLFLRNKNCRGNAVGWFEIYVDDMNRAKNFYEKVFQRPLGKLDTPTEELEMYSFNGTFGAYGANGAIVKMNGMKAGGSSVINYFACEDCEIEQSRIVEAGGKVEKSKFSIGPYGHISLVYDTEGNMIGLHSMK